MAELTIHVPDELAQRLEPFQHRLPELLTQLVEALSPRAVSPDVATLVAHPMGPPLAYAEVLDFLLNRPTPEAIIAFQVSPVAQARICALLEKNREAALNATEAAELDLYEQLEHLMMLLKARPCTSSLRINPKGLSVDPRRSNMAP
jgi:hypothetical protein